MKRIDRPQPGFFKVRSRRGGPWLPAEIREDLPIDPLTLEILDRSQRLEAFRDGRPVDIEAVWFWGTQISKDEWEWLKAQSAIRRMFR